MIRTAHRAAHGAIFWLSHAAGRITGRYYFEDYKRVYPDRLAFNRLGRRREARKNDVNNYLNHRKFYEFASQFAREKTVADVGCGSGYGCEILKHRGARDVHGCDLSASALRFARQQFGTSAQFTRQGITDLRGYADAAFDVTISSEVLEHVKEYGMEKKALQELRRVTRPGGLLVIATPNSELLGAHGFSFAEMQELFTSNFKDACIFENALVPFGQRKGDWQQRVATGNVGVVVSQRINLEETVLPDGGSAELKSGLAAGSHRFGELCVNTSLLHNTHSWVVLARVGR